MKVVLSWLKELVDCSGISVDELARQWTLAGLEVDGVELVGDWWDRERLLVGAITRVAPHPNADRLVLAFVDYGGDGPHQVVTGSPMLMEMRQAGDLEKPLKVAYAMEGIELFDGHTDGWVKQVLKGRKVRGIMSDAMVCSEKELGLGDEHEDILILDDEAPVGEPLVDWMGDAVLSLDLTPNLARAMSMIGVARETAAILERPFELPQPEVVTAGGQVEERVSVEIDDADLCPRYTARLIRDVVVRPSPPWMARRLTLAGMRPISGLVDITNYVMLEWGEPMHAFDYDSLVKRAESGRPRIVVRRGKRGEKMITLDGVQRNLDEDTLLITDDAGPIAIAGVMGGADTEVGEGTTSVLLEAAVFDNINIRRTSRMQKLPSESSARFGRGVHPEVAGPASIRCAGLMSELADGSVVAGVVDAYPRPPEPVTVSLPTGELDRLLGVEISATEAKSLLERLEFEVEMTNEGLTATVPPHRMDVSIPADLVEEVARMYGYDKLPSTRLSDPLPVQRDNPDLEVEERARDALVAAGLFEAASMRLVSIEHEAHLTPGTEPDPSSYLSLSNPISPERSSLRRSILTGLLDAARLNLRFTDRVALFEIGPVYHAVVDALPDEPRRVGVVMVGPSADRGWRDEASRSMDFYDGKGAVEALLEGFGISAKWEPGEHPAMHPSRTAAVLEAEQVVGHVGELQPVVREHWDLAEHTVAAADLDLDALAEAAELTGTFEAFSAYPPVHEDLAVVVDEAVSAEAVADVVRGAGGSLLVDLQLFDVYRGSQIEPGKKSLAWSLKFQAADKTLTSEAATAVRGRIVKALADELGASIRE